MPSVKSNLKIPSCAQNVAEIAVPREIKFTAPLPSWLTGNLWFSGPGTFDLEKGSIKSWLDGFTMITKLEIGHESLKISSKHVNTINYKKAIKAKQPVMPGIMHPPGPDESRGFFSKLVPFGLHDINDNCIGLVVNISSKFYAMADGSTIYEINPKNLSTMDHFNTQKVFGLNNICPEVLKDVKTGDLYICGSAIKATFQNVIVKIPFSAKNIRIEENSHVLGSIPSRWKFGPCCLRKCFALTENYIVFLETPHVVNVMKVAATYIKNYKMFDWMDWIPGEKTRIYLMHKATGKVVKIEYLMTQAYVILDIVNAYEENGKIILDICCTQPDNSLFEGFSLSNIRSLISPKTYTPGNMERFVIPLIADGRRQSGSLLSSDVKSKAIRKGDRVILTSELLNQNGRGYDLACINPNYRSMKHCFTYVTCCLPTTISRTSPIGHAVAKIHLGEAGYPRLTWEAGVGYQTWVPVFVPNPTSGSNKEDDGVLICLVTNLAKKHSDFLVVIDAMTMKEISRVEFKDCPVASYYLATFYFAE